MRALVAVVATLLLAAAPASGAELLPVGPHADNVGTRVVLQLQAPRASFGIRKVARQVNQEVPGLHIRRFGKCADRPDLYCLRVRVADYGTWEENQTRWVGQYRVENDVDLIELNTSYQPNQSVACHELGHALGLQHHDSRGCVGYPSGDYFSSLELSSLRAAYPADS